LIYFTYDPDVSFTSFRSVRNFVIDVRQMPASASATGLHWQVAQATSLINVVVNMSTASGNNHQGAV
jgi:glucan 1,3-beta-glucosidase